MDFGFSFIKNRNRLCNLINQILPRNVTVLYDWYLLCQKRRVIQESTAQQLLLTLWGFIPLSDHFIRKTLKVTALGYNIKTSTIHFKRRDQNHRHRIKAIQLSFPWRRGLLNVITVSVVSFESFWRQSWAFVWPVNMALWEGSFPWRLAFPALPH